MAVGVCVLPRAVSAKFSPEAARAFLDLRMNPIDAPPAVGAARGSPDLDTGKLKRFVEPLPMSEIAKPSGMRPNPMNPAEKLPFYRMTMGEIESRVHRELEPARMWGFNGISPGPVIDVRSGKGVLVTILPR